MSGTNTTLKSAVLILLLAASQACLAGGLDQQKTKDDRSPDRTALSNRPVGASETASHVGLASELERFDLETLRVPENRLAFVELAYNIALQVSAVNKMDASGVLSTAREHLMSFEVGPSNTALHYLTTNLSVRGRDRWNDLMSSLDVRMKVFEVADKYIKQTRRPVRSSQSLIPLARQNKRLLLGEYFGKKVTGIIAGQGSKTWSIQFADGSSAEVGIALPVSIEGMPDESASRWVVYRDAARIPVCLETKDLVRIRSMELRGVRLEREDNLLVLTAESFDFAPPTQVGKAGTGTNIPRVSNRTVPKRRYLAIYGALDRLTSDSNSSFPFRGSKLYNCILQDGALRPQETYYTKEMDEPVRGALVNYAGPRSGVVHFKGSSFVAWELTSRPGTSPHMPRTYLLKPAEMGKVPESEIPEYEIDSTYIRIDVPSDNQQFGLMQILLKDYFWWEK